MENEKSSLSKCNATTELSKKKHFDSKIAIDLFCKLFKKPRNKKIEFERGKCQGIHEVLETRL